MVAKGTERKSNPGACNDQDVILPDKSTFLSIGEQKLFFIYLLIII